MEKSTFVYQYSSERNREVEAIRSKYLPKNESKDSMGLDRLRELDNNVKRPVEIFAYTLGSISAIIMGSGMSLVMTDIGTTLGIENSMVAGVVIGIVGIAFAAVNYPMYKKLINLRKKMYAPKILKLSEELMNN